MQLKKWLKKEGRSVVWLNSKMKCETPRRVQTILLGAPPTPAEIWKIQEITNMEVTLEDFIKVNRRKAKK